MSTKTILRCTPWLGFVTNVSDTYVEYQVAYPWGYHVASGFVRVTGI